MLAKLSTETIPVVDGAGTTENSGDGSTKYIELNLPSESYSAQKSTTVLMRARVVGAKMANSKLIVFFDSLCKAYHNWFRRCSVCNYCLIDFLNSK